MAINIATADPTALFSAIKKAINEGHVETWQFDQNGYLTHSPSQWRNLAWLKPSIQQGTLTLNIIRPKDGHVSSEIYAVYHGRFIEMVLAHFDKMFTSADASAMAPYVQDLIRFGLNTGLRIGEIFGLRWANADLEKGILNVFAPKTQKSRAVPINSDARKVLEYWALGRRNEFVFYNPETGEPFVDLKTGFGLACRKAGIEGVTWHTLRHTFASRLVDRGVDIVTVQQLLGHSSITVTMRYTHTNLDSKRAAVAKLENHGDSLVTVRPERQQVNGKLSQMRR